MISQPRSARILPRCCRLAAIRQIVDRSYQPNVATDAHVAKAQPEHLLLRHYPRLLILEERACNLAHHDARRITRIRQVVAVGGKDARAALNERKQPQLLSD
jgi:hypothetical protein